MPKKLPKINVNGIPIASGVHDCYWVLDRKCTNPAITRNKIPKGYSRDWESAQNCPLTILGTIYCGGFKFINERQNSSLFKFERISKTGGGE